MITLSASKIKTFLECQNRYYWRYIQNIPDPKTIYAVLGTSFHKAIEYYYKYGRNPYEVYEQTWKKELAAGKLEHDNKLYYDGLEMLDLYPGGDDQRRPSSLELRFCLPFPNREQPICEIKGIIDQHYEDARMVWDLKTAKRKPNAKQLNNDVQFILYSFACEQLFGYKPSIFWYHARDGTLLQAKVDEPEKIDYITSVVKQMLVFHENPTPKVVDKTCFFCPYVNRCKGEQNDGNISNQERSTL